MAVDDILAPSSNSTRGSCGNGSRVPTLESAKPGADDPVWIKCSTDFGAAAFVFEPIAIQ